MPILPPGSAIHFYGALRISVPNLVDSVWSFPVWVYYEFRILEDLVDEGRAKF